MRAGSSISRAYKGAKTALHIFHLLENRMTLFFAHINTVQYACTAWLREEKRTQSRYNADGKRVLVRVGGA